MDNATYNNELSLTPINTDEIYSRLRTTEIKIEPSYERQKRADIAKKGEKQNDSSNSMKINTVMIIMMVVFLLISLTSITLSVTFNQLASEQSNVLSQLHKPNDDIVTDPFDTIEKNLSQNVMELVETQLITAQSNMSRNLNQLDVKLEMFISLLTQYLKVQTQMYCGPGLWHRLIFLNMSDPTHQCPSVWKEYNTSGVRACGRPINSSGSCAAIRHLTDRQYSRVCGSVIGYQFASPDAFRHIE